jgi:hypothetical protein
VSNSEGQPRRFAFEDAVAARTRELNATRLWLSSFVEGLHIGLREEDVTTGKRLEAQNRSLVEAASREESQRRRDHEAHQEHLKLQNTQLALEEKEAKRVAADGQRDLTEKAVLEQQTRLHGLLENEKKTHADIHETHKELTKLLAEYHSAKEMHDAQDPKDRERSFMTYLGGAAPDPNGIDVR